MIMTGNFKVTHDHKPTVHSPARKALRMDEIRNNKSTYLPSTSDQKTKTPK